MKPSVASSSLRAIALTCVSALLVGCSDAEQAEFLDAAEQMGEQVAKGMDRLGERMDALLGDTETDFAELARQLREIDLPALQAELEPQLAETREEFERLQQELDEEGAALTPQQRERVQEVRAEIERVTRETRDALDASDAELQRLGSSLSETLAALEATLAKLQAEVESGSGG